MCAEYATHITVLFLVFNALVNQDLISLGTALFLFGFVYFQYPTLPSGFWDGPPIHSLP